MKTKMIIIPTHKTALMSTLLIAFTCSIVFTSTAYAQSTPAYTTSRDNLIKLLKKREISPAFTQSIDHFYFTSCDSLIKEKVVVDGRPIDVILTRLFDACSDQLNKRVITMLRIPSVNNSFLLTLK